MLGNLFFNGFIFVLVCRVHEKLLQAGNLLLTLILLPTKPELEYGVLELLEYGGGK